MNEIQFANGFDLRGTVSEVTAQGITRGGTLWVRATVKTVENQQNGEAKIVNVPVVAFRASAVTLKDMEPGTEVAITGKLRSRSYETQSGETRLNLDAVVDQVATVEAE